MFLCSDWLYCRQVTDHATTALLHYQLPQMPDVVVRSFMVRALVLVQLVSLLTCVCVCPDLAAELHQTLPVVLSALWSLPAGRTSSNMEGL